MQDQVEALRGRGSAAGALHSHHDADEQRTTEADAPTNYKDLNDAYPAAWFRRRGSTRCGTSACSRIIITCC